jgi:UDP-glucose-4-epimerase GalE
MTESPAVRPAVLVTGGAGYIGAVACRALAEAGFLPVAYDDLSVGEPGAVRWGPLEIGDIRDEGGLAEVCGRHRPVGVMHFAALALVGESMREPERYRSVNLDGTAAVARAALAAGVRAFVLSSTCAVYGTPDRLPISEDTPRRPINPYGASKAAAEDATFAIAGGAMGCVALRYFNAAGAGDGLGEARAVETHLVPLTIDAALGRRPALEVYGDDYPTPDGTAVRDYIHVEDLAEAHVRSLRRLLDGGANATLNLGTGVGASVRQVIEAVERAGGRPVPHRTAPRRPGDPAELVADPSLAARTLGPGLGARSDLGRIVADAWTWRRSWTGPATPAPTVAA